jgi:drug/metabolite transporter (DMT)-like permease
MNSPAGLHLKTYVLIFLMVIFGPLGNVMLGKGMKQIGPVTSFAPADLFHLFVNIFTTGAIWLGIGSLVTFFVAYMLVLSWADYSYVQPASSFSYVIVALLAHFLLREAVTPLRWIGVSVICLGVLVVGQTPPRTTEHRQ